MSLYLVRHAKAGHRSSWRGADLVRPLTKAGRAQAQAITAWLANEPITRILSSPFTRCIETVEPLASKLGLPVEITQRLTEDVSFEPALELLLAVPEHSVLCSHGDLIPDVIGALGRRGTLFSGTADWRKGSTWILTREDGEIVEARAVPPPDG
jgi:8-oxo-dGTP diphosphatase